MIKLLRKIRYYIVSTSTFSSSINSSILYSLPYYLITLIKLSAITSLKISSFLSGHSCSTSPVVSDSSLILESPSLTPGNYTSWLSSCFRSLLFLSLTYCFIFLLNVALLVILSHYPSLTCTQYKHFKESVTVLKLINQFTEQYYT